MHSFGRNGWERSPCFLEKAQPQAMAVLHHIGLVGKGEGTPPFRRSLEGGLKQDPDSLARMDGQIHGALRLGGALQAVGPFRVFTEDLDADIGGADALQRHMGIQEGVAGAEVHMEFQFLP